ncbi:hypothetical protein DFH07DRAFT_939280 [Mycena maculata]|uniref:Uncharacterized protein n=1 Tax=Mycena maculata TaxID=230809 RepID=A0AAD7JFK7_9AGAR|nr:hypothetical protein DFH07DRAFT_939280 [Mycena maculata]
MSQRRAAQVRLNVIIEYLTVAAAAVQWHSLARCTPYLNSIPCSLLSLVASVQKQTVKYEYLELMEEIHTVLYALIKLLTKSKTGEALPPVMSNGIQTFIQTLENIHLFLESQQDRLKIKHSSRGSANTALLEDCRAGLREAFGAFKARRTHISPQQAHEDLLRYVSQPPLATTSRSEFTMNGTPFRAPKGNEYESQSYSGSLYHYSPKIFSAPSQPQSFKYGRKEKFRHIVDVVARESVRTVHWVSSRFQANHITDY